MSPVIGILDCNNYYVSCERAFAPELIGVPCVVLSNNDGNVVARSAESKALGIKMGEPIHLIRDKIKAHGVRVLSSNYALYGQMQARVLASIAPFARDIEVYSIDEVFIDFAGFEDRNLVVQANAMRDQCLRWTTIPTCVGLGPIKTLAKAANHAAKRNPIFNGVADLRDEDIRRWVLDRIAVEDGWGVGHATAAKVRTIGITNLGELRDMPMKQARAMGTVVLERLVTELRGIPAGAVELIAPARKGMAVTRSFGQPATELTVVIAALAQFAMRGGEKLREHGLVAARITMFFHTNRFKPDRPQYSAARTMTLHPMTNDSLELIAAIRRGAERAWRDGFAITKAGIMLDDLMPAALRP